MDELIVGTYEGFLLGYSVYPDDNVSKLKQTFATHSHTASVRCLTTGGKFLASGGTDDKVVIIDLRTRKEHTVLMNHDGTINTVVFTNSGTHLLTGSDDGQIIVTRTGNWQIEKIWKKAHGGQPVTAITVHPSDKLALSIGGDKTLRTWNLIKGRPAFTINLSSKGITMPTEIKFSPGGDRFSLVYQQCVDVWTISKAGVEKHVTCNSKPTTVQWVSDDKMFVGLDNGNIISLFISNSQATTFQAHKQRVKCLHFENETLYSASSTGELKVWCAKEDRLREICLNKAGCRITCMTLNKQNHIIKKEKTSDDEKNEENEDKDVYSDDSDDEPAEKVTLPKKRQPGAFVKISYDSDDDGITNEDTLSTTKKKKLKKRKRNKKSKNKEN